MRSALNVLSHRFQGGKRGRRERHREKKGDTERGYKWFLWHEYRAGISSLLLDAHVKVRQTAEERRENRNEKC